MSKHADIGTTIHPCPDWRDGPAGHEFDSLDTDGTPIRMHSHLVQRDVGGDRYIATVYVQSLEGDSVSGGPRGSSSTSRRRRLHRGSGALGRRVAARGSRPARPGHVMTVTSTELLRAHAAHLRLAGYRPASVKHRLGIFTGLARQIDPRSLTETTVRISRSS
jgi:hypothetical protein